jgi:hypothetical protein
MSSRDWIGEVEQPSSVAYGLKRFFKVDLDKGTGFIRPFGKARAIVSLVSRAELRKFYLSRTIERNSGSTLKVHSKDALVKRLVFVWRDAVRATQNMEEALKKPHKAYFGRKGSYFLSSRGAYAFDQIIDELKKAEEKRSKFSDQYLERILNEAIIKLERVKETQIQSMAQKQINSMFKILAAPAVDWTLLVPITNLDIEMNELEIGNVKFLKLKNYLKTDLQLRSGRLAPQLGNILDQNFADNVCAKVVVSAVDEDRAKDIGTQEISLALDALRFYGLNSCFPNPMFARNYFDMQGNISSGKQIMILFSSVIFTIPREIKGFLFGFKITKSALTSMKSDGFDMLSAILKKHEKDRTEFEKALVTGVRFCALSTQDLKIFNSFVDSTISLEALLLAQHDSKRDNLAERVAFIIGKNLNERNHYYDEMKNLYGIRCGIVHSGNTDVRSSDLRELQWIDYTCLVNMLNLYRRLNINNVGDLVAWIRRQKFK